jgi:hypothetical protein
MTSIVRSEDIEEKILTIREQRVLLDSDIAELYGVETRDINKSVKNNPDKFPESYVIELSKLELEDLRWKFSTAKFAMTRTMPKSFTEKGLYMLATILKSTAATQATLGIIETFTKHRELARTVKQLSTVPDKPVQKALMQRSGELIAELLDDDLQTSDAETTIELNFAVLKFKHTIKKKRSP